MNTALCKKRIPLAIFLFVSCGLTVLVAGNTPGPQHVNVEPVAGKPGSYLVGIRFDAVEKVMLHELPGRSNAGRAPQELLPSEWRYDRERNLLLVTRPIDDERYIVRVFGRYALPLTIVLHENSDASSVRVIVDSRIARQGSDYIIEPGQVTLMSCPTGNEKFLVQYTTPDGACSIGSITAGDLTRPLLEYAGFPVEGNTRCADAEGRVFTVLDNDVRDVWLVQLLPLADGYTGCDMRSGFRWNAASRQVVCDEPVDVKKYTVMVYGALD